MLLAWPRPTRALIDLVTRPAQAAAPPRAAPRVVYGSSVVAVPARRRSCSRPLIAIPAWGCECVGFALICDAFPGAHVDLGLAMVIYAGTTIAGALSFLPGGLGVTEGAMTLALVRRCAASTGRPPSPRRC